MSYLGKLKSIEEKKVKQEEYQILKGKIRKALAAYNKKDYETALREWIPLAEQGHANAQYNLGAMYHKGEGVLQDYKTAAQLWKLAADQGHANAQNSLGAMYFNGQKFPQDYKAAVKWYRLAAEQGHAKAQFHLGRMYEDGNGIPQDFVLAHMLSNLAASNGDEGAGESRDILGEDMTSSQIEKAQDLTRERGTYDCV